MRAIILLTLTAVTGCASYQNAYAPERFHVDAIPKGYGTVIISTGAPKSCVSMATFLTIQPASENEESKSAFTLPVDGRSTKSDFADHQGNVSVISMPAGNYKITPQVANFVVEGVKVPVATFSVSHDETRYVGEYFIPSSCSFNMQMIINDKRDRDLSIATQKNPGIDRAAVVTRLATFIGSKP